MVSETETLPLDGKGADIRAAREELAAAREFLKEAKVKEQEAKQRDKTARQEHQDRRLGTLSEAAEQFVGEHPRLFYVVKSGYYGEWAYGEWHWMKPDALSKQYADLFTINFARHSRSP